MYLSFDPKYPEKRPFTSLPNCIVSEEHPTVGVASGHNFESLGTYTSYLQVFRLSSSFFKFNSSYYKRSIDLRLFTQACTKPR